MATSSLPPPLPPRTLPLSNMKALRKRPLPSLPVPLPYLEAHLAGEQQPDQRVSLGIEKLSEGEKGALDEKIRKLQANARGMIARVKVPRLRAERVRVRAEQILRDLERQAEKDKIANQPGRAANKLFIGALGFGGVAFLALLIWLHA